jgi:hypothetical protein
MDRMLYQESIACEAVKRAALEIVHKSYRFCEGRGRAS